MSHLMDLDIVMTGKELSSGFPAPAQLQSLTFWLYARQLMEVGIVPPLDTPSPEPVLRSSTRVSGQLTMPVGSLLPLEANSLWLHGSRLLLLRKLLSPTPTSETQTSHSRMPISTPTLQQLLFNDFIYPRRIDYFFLRQLVQQILQKMGPRWTTTASKYQTDEKASWAIYILIYKTFTTSLFVHLMHFSSFHPIILLAWTFHNQMAGPSTKGSSETIARLRIPFIALRLSCQERNQERGFISSTQSYRCGWRTFFGETMLRLTKVISGVWQPVEHETTDIQSTLFPVTCLDFIHRVLLVYSDRWVGAGVILGGQLRVMEAVSEIPCWTVTE